MGKSAVGLTILVFQLFSVRWSVSVIPEFSNVLLHVDKSLASSVSVYEFSLDVYRRVAESIRDDLIVALCPLDYEIKITLGGIRHHRKSVRLI